MKTNRAFTWIEVLVAIAIIAIFASIPASYIIQQKQMHESYNAWVKQTGNPNQLTYGEWRALMRAYHRVDDSANSIPMPQ